MELQSGELQTLYSGRFGTEMDHRDDIWKVLCKEYFQRWVPATSVVLDIAAGHCEFINNITAARKIAIDLNPDVKIRAAQDVETYLQRSDAMTSIESGSVDVAFVSNFFEHVSRDVILATLVEARRVLAPNGRLLILQPNVRYCARDYWMFFDHITPVDDRALAEALTASGFDLVKCIPRFLPYTTKSRRPSHPVLVRLYLKIPIFWRVFGAQAFMVATPSPHDKQ